MALTANREVDRFVDQELRSYRVAATSHVYKGAFVGLTSGGYARGLIAGDDMVGLAYEEADNSAGADGAVSVRVYTEGDFDVALSGAVQADIGRPVYASADDTLSYDPTANSFVGYVQDWISAGRIILRLNTAGPVNFAHLKHQSGNTTLTVAQSGLVFTNLGAVGVIDITLPQNPPKGTQYKFVNMADLEMRIKPGAAGAVFIKGAKQADNKYVSTSDIGDFMHLIADGNGDWVAVASISGADGDIGVEP